MAVIGFGARRRRRRRIAELETIMQGRYEQIIQRPRPRPYALDYRVSEAARALDEVRPGWDTIIDPGTLKLESSLNCVCGQLASHKAHYDSMEWNNAWHTISAEVTGRIGPHSAFSATCPDELWLAEIRARRLAKTVTEDSLATAGD